MLFGKHFHRQEMPWEVVDSKAVAPIPMWDEDEGQFALSPICGAVTDFSFVVTELEVVRMHDCDMSFKFVHDLRRETDLRKAVQFARHQLLQEASRRNYNIMIVEG